MKKQILKWLALGVVLNLVENVAMLYYYDVPLTGASIKNSLIFAVGGILIYEAIKRKHL
jgi:hypothetical protein